MSKRNVCLTIRTTKELSMELDGYRCYMRQKGTVAHMLLQRIFKDLKPYEINILLNQTPGFKLKMGVMGLDC